MSTWSSFSKDGRLPYKTPTADFDQIAVIWCAANSVEPPELGDNEADYAELEF